MMMVKICGIRTEEAVRAAVEAGADAIGVVLAKSRRQVSAERARLLLQGAGGALKVGVFAGQSPAEVADLADRLALDVVQLSGGEEPEEFARSVRQPIWLACAHLPEPVPDVEALIFDAQREGGYGGTGQLADWREARVACRRARVILAGGLTPANVAEAIEAVRPSGVDVSSGVERDGDKDPDLIRAFVASARRMADAHGV